MAIIKDIFSFKVLNSRGHWSLETHVLLSDGSLGISNVAEGASTGIHEAHVFPADKAINIVNTTLRKALVGHDASDQQGIDKLMCDLDGTPQKRNLGGNSILSVSLAVAKANAKSLRMPLYSYIHLLYNGTPLKDSELVYPTPVFNILNGGKHAHNGLSFQEFMVIPSRSLPIDKAIDLGQRVYMSLKSRLEDLGYNTGVGDEGGFAPSNLTPPKALELIRSSASEVASLGKDIFLGMDIATDSFYNPKTKKYEIKEQSLLLDSSGLLDYYEDLLKNLEFMYLEDPFFEQDHAGWKECFKRLGKRMLIVGDDLVVTNPKLLNKAIKEDLLNAVIVKPNQVGTLSETLDFIHLAHKHSLSIVVSHRSGSSPESTFISDLALGAKAEFLKSGSPVRGERVSKYNRLLRIQSHVLRGTSPDHY